MPVGGVHRPEVVPRAKRGSILVGREILNKFIYVVGVPALPPNDACSKWFSIC